MKFLSLVIFFITISCLAEAQHQHHDDPVRENKIVDSFPPSHAYSRNLPMSRNGSGTGWAPDASPMYMYMMRTEKGRWMFHGNIFIRYNNQDFFNKGSKATSDFDVPNMLMGMYNRPIGKKGLLNFTAMISLDPLTQGKSGYPLLFQTGETFQDQRLVDRQHPHDLISALSAAYTYSVNKDIDITAYAAYPGEPALGPGAFMHRVSAMNNPNAPLGHHWQDATHTSFGVSTLGLRFRKLKLEGSLFNGREPDEERFNFDPISLNSYSYRISFNPISSLALQFSQGFLKEPERLEPGEDVVRTTASIMHSHSMRTMSWSQTVVWGMNQKDSDGNPEHSFLYENNLQFRTQAIYSRFEVVNKSAKDLRLDAHFGVRNFTIQTLTVGYNHRIAPASPVEISAGLQSTFNFTPTALRYLYGKTPIGLQIYLQIRPHRHG